MVAIASAMTGKIFKKYCNLNLGFSVLGKLCFLNLKITKEVFIKTLKQNETETFDALSSKATLEGPSQSEKLPTISS